MIVMCECTNCGLSTNHIGKEFIITDLTKEKALDKIKCRTCCNEFSIEEGIIKAIISENRFNDGLFMSNRTYPGRLEIEVGKSYKIKLKSPVNKINSIMIGKYGNFEVKTDYTNMVNEEGMIDSFFILTSEFANYNNDSDTLKIGSKSKIDYGVYAYKIENVPVWIQFLIQAKEALIDGNYTFAILSSEISFESYIDQTLMELFSFKEIDKETAHVILESMNNIYDKVYKLLFNLGNIKFKDKKDLNKKWQRLVETRNKIAHGEKISHTKEEAEEAFENVVRSIFYINREGPIDNIYNTLINNKL